ncbi:MAG: hypothetical protein ACMXYA_03575, partial [Candidatus Woesearchaeota archaeon]
FESQLKIAHVSTQARRHTIESGSLLLIDQQLYIPYETTSCVKEHIFTIEYVTREWSYINETRTFWIKVFDTGDLEDIRALEKIRENFEIMSKVHETRIDSLEKLEGFGSPSHAFSTIDSHVVYIKNFPSDDYLSMSFLSPIMNYVQNKPNDCIQNNPANQHFFNETSNMKEYVQYVEFEYKFESLSENEAQIWPLEIVEMQLPFSTQIEIYNRFSIYVDNTSWIRNRWEHLTRDRSNQDILEVGFVEILPDGPEVTVLHNELSHTNEFAYRIYKQFMHSTGEYYRHNYNVTDIECDAIFLVDGTFVYITTSTGYISPGNTSRKQFKEIIRSVGKYLDIDTSIMQ